MAINTATYTGESGVVKFSSDASNVVAMGSVRSFSIDQETHYKKLSSKSSTVLRINGYLSK